MFRILLEYIGRTLVVSDKKLLFDLVVHFGRYDDLYAFVGTAYEDAMFLFLKTQFESDLTSEFPSLLGKWLKSENTSSRESRRLGEKTRVAFGLTPKRYRLCLTQLRRRLNIVERAISQKLYSCVEYSKIPGKALLQYRGAFQRNDSDRFAAFLQALKERKTSANTDVIYPYEIYRLVHWRSYDEAVAQLWDAQKEWGVANKNALVVADTSGSMETVYKNTPMPIFVSISLAIYMAERNVGYFKNHFITFSNEPSLVTITGDTIFDKAVCFQSIHHLNTNIQAVFDLLLETGRTYNIPSEEMPEVIYIISDMEFDQADAGNYKTNFEVIKEKYKEFGYSMPKLVFWNVSSRQRQSPVRFDERGTVLVSGLSPSIFEQVISNVTPYEFMERILSLPRYKDIQLK